MSESARSCCGRACLRAATKGMRGERRTGVRGREGSHHCYDNEGIKSSVYVQRTAVEYEREEAAVDT